MLVEKETSKVGVAVRRSRSDSSAPLCTKGATRGWCPLGERARGKSYTTQQKRMPYIVCNYTAFESKPLTGSPNGAQPSSEDSSLGCVFLPKSGTGFASEQKTIT